MHGRRDLEPQSCLAEQIRQALELVRKAGENACAQLQAQQDNPAVTRLGPAGGAFVVRFSQLGRPLKSNGMPGPANWSTFMQDWRGQYDLVADLIRSSRLHAVAAILRTGRHSEPGATSHFAPQVVARLREILGDLEPVLAADESLRAAPKTAGGHP